MVLPVNLLAGHPVALEDKHFLEWPLHAQPEKSVTSAESENGAAATNSASYK